MGGEGLRTLCLDLPKLTAHSSSLIMYDSYLAHVACQVAPSCKLKIHDRGNKPARLERKEERGKRKA